MCHRQLRFDRHVDCGHLTFTGETNIDCHKPDCTHSTAHPPNCGEPGRPTCICKRYYTQPERISRDVAGKCARCS
ncbi:hypothetical protein BDY19DRAFT_265988 [Irpex rosettiformis]|uniref:Uncharacterized protein n=1 Tax=Irpex rosettiformis TaxID=378272 RepID=A0ACB8UH19_9APHY|nr:hypothetical protein BDY19DRAFT_265988 [Irpex rosettiformis]